MMLQRTSALLLLGLCAAGAAPQADQPQVDQPADQLTTAADLVYMRSVREGDRVLLQSASREYVSSKPWMPVVTLVGVMHIGDPTYYDSIEAELAKSEIVLYESVMPSGTRPPRGTSPEERVESTKRAMMMVRGAVEAHLKAEGGLPTSLDALVAPAQARDSRQGAWLQGAMKDAWGRPFIYEVIDNRNYWLRCLGADGAEGGSGESEDLRLKQMTKPPAADGDSLQQSLAEALGLSFQLNQVDYGKDRWLCVDMTVDELGAAFKRRGLDFDEFEGSFRSSGLQGQAVESLLALIRLANAMSNGMVAQAAKVMMAEMLGDPATMKEGLGEAGDPTGEVILGDRNELVWSDLEPRLRPSKSAKSIAVFYGAAHMPDFDARLRTLGYAPRTESWLTVFEADAKKSGLDAATLDSVRKSMRDARAKGKSR